MRGKTIVITGGTSGIGEVAAVALAKMGARIVLVARDKSRGDATLARLRDNAPSIAHSVYFADLLRLAQMKRVAAEIADRERRIDVLINNAGALFSGEYECYCRWSIRKRLLGFHHSAERCHHISQRHQPECAASPRQKVKDYCEQSHYYPDDKYWLAWCVSSRWRYSCS